MKQNVLEKLGVKLIFILLLIFTFIAFIGSFFFVPHLIVLDSKTFYLVVIEVIGVFFFLCMIKMLYTFISNLPPKYDFIFAAACMIFISVIQLLVVKFFEIRALDDLNKVTNMAVDLVNQKKFTSINSYFSMYTNNIPLTVYLSQYFKLLFHFGFRNYTMAGSLLGVFSINISIIVTSLILKELKGKKLALFFISFNVFNPLIYLWGTFYYTTIIALPFMMIGIYLIIKLQNETNIIIFCLKICLLTIVLYIGIQIRPTTSFVLIGALGLIIMKLPSYKFESSQIKSSIKKLLFSITVICISLFLVNSYYHKILDPSMEADYSETSFPATHWVMMGLKDKGSYNWTDEQATLSYSTRDARIAFHKKEIANRLQNMGVSGLGKLIINKLIYTWSDGSHDYPVTMRASHNFTKLLKYVTGEKRDALILYCQIFNIALLFILVMHLFKMLNSKSTPNSMLIYIVLLGGFLFHLLWEANPKYSLNFIFLVMFIDMEGIQDFFQKEQLSVSFSKVIVLLGNVFIMLSIVIAFLLYPHFTKESMDFDDLVQGQFVSYKDQISDMNSGAYLYQNFRTNRAFNSLTFQVCNYSDTLDAVYTAEIIDENQTVLYSTEFSPTTQYQVEAIEFNFNTIKPSKPTTFYIKISSEEVTPEQTLLFCMSNKQGYDVFPHGNLTMNNQEIEGDLAFEVSCKTRTAYTNTFYYVLVIAGILAIEFIVLFYNKKQYLLQSSENATFQST